MKFFFHYNKPASRAKGKPVISVHYRGSCTLVSNIECNVKTAGRIRNRQPFFVIAGDAKSIEIVDDVAIIR